MIEIVPYNPGWPAEFEQIAAVLRRGLGSLALRIDHIGSTSVPGLDAKDIIDLQVGVDNFDDPLEAAFLAMGCTRVAYINDDHLPPGYAGLESEWEKRYFRPPPDMRPTHLHVRILGRANWRYALLFRDYLRSHPAAASGYAAVKHILVEYHPDDPDAYTLIKDPVCDVIMAAAEEWARQTGRVVTA